MKSLLSLFCSFLPAGKKASKNYKSNFWVFFPSGKKASKNCKSNFWVFFPKGKKAMEMWQIVLLILAIIFLLFMLIWFGGLRDTIVELLVKLGDMF